jgi:hypothetical protein
VAQIWADGGVQLGSSQPEANPFSTAPFGGLPAVPVLRSLARKDESWHTPETRSTESVGTAAEDRATGVWRALYVDAVPRGVGGEHLRDYFERFGSIESVAVHPKKIASRPKKGEPSVLHFAFVNFVEHGSAVQALEACIRREVVVQSADGPCVVTAQWAATNGSRNAKARGRKTRRKTREESSGGPAAPAAPLDAYMADVLQTFNDLVLKQAVMEQATWHMLSAPVRI